MAPERNLVRYYIGIEGFHTTHSVAVMSRPDGTLVSTSRLPVELHLHTVDARQLAARIQQLVTGLYVRARHRHADEFRDISSTANLLRSAHACFGISGVTFRYDRQVVLPGILKNAGWPEDSHYVCTGDAEITFVSHTRRLGGSMMLAGSGSTAYVVAARDGIADHYRCGGWGPALGDEGSAYRIGCAALRAVGRQIDQDERHSLLWEKIRAWLRQPEPHTISAAKASARWALLEDELTRQHTHEMDPRTLIFRFAHEFSCMNQCNVWRHIASRLAIPVMQAYREGDALAVGIVHDALVELDSQHQEACTRAARDGHTELLPLVLTGGLLIHNPELCQRLVALFSARASRADAAPIPVMTQSDPATMRPALGALLFALGNSQQESLRLPEPSLMQRVYEEQRRSEFTGDLAHG